MLLVTDPFGVNYLYSRKRFGWEATDYAMYRTAICSGMVFGNIHEYYIFIVAYYKFIAS